MKAPVVRLRENSENSEMLSEFATFCWARYEQPPAVALCKRRARRSDPERKKDVLSATRKGCRAQQLQAAPAEAICTQRRPAVLQQMQVTSSHPASSVLHYLGNRNTCSNLFLPSPQGSQQHSMQDWADLSFQRTAPPLSCIPLFE